MPTFAAVDIGSNSVRLKIARLTRGRLRAVHEDREVTRLGEGVFRSGFLTPESMAETVKVLRRFHRATQQIVTDTVRVVATSALRDARNSQAFLEWVRSATGWNVEIVSGLEEARLIHLGLLILRGETVPPYNYIAHRLVTPASLRKARIASAGATTAALKRKST